MSCLIVLWLACSIVQMSTKVARSSRVSSKLKPITSPYLASIYDELNEQIDKILGDDEPIASVTVSFQRLYKFVEFLCRAKLQSKVAENLFRKFDKFLERVLEPLAEAKRAGQPLVGLLGKFVDITYIIDAKVTALEKIHIYLDRTYLLNHPTKRTFVTYTLNKIGDAIYDSEELHEATEIAYMNAFADYRSNGGESLEPLLIRGFHFCDRLLKTNVPDFNFKQEIIEALKEQSLLFNHEVMNNSPEEEIFDSMYARVYREVKFWDKVGVSEDFKAQIKHESVLALVFNDFEKNAMTIVKPLFISKKFSSIVRLFKFIQNSNYYASVLEDDSPYLKIFAKVWYTYIVQYLSELFKENHQDIIEKLVKSKKNLTLLMNEYMDSNSEIEFRLREAFQAALHASNKDSEILNKLLKYIDAFFKTTNGGDGDESTQTINDIHLIFKSVKTKTTFIKQYQRDLARRLITQSTKNVDLERSLVSKIEEEVGFDQCSPLVTMFNDLVTSKDLVDIFREQLSLDESPKFEGFNPLVLDNKAWPVPKSSIKIPEDLNDMMTRFQHFYLGQSNKKKLNWSPALSYMSINARFKQGVKELQVSTFQGIVLLLFNDHDYLSFNEIKQHTELDSKSLSSILYSLSMGKYKILNKDTTGVYSMNEDFNDRKKVIKVKQIQVKLKNGEEEDVWVETEDSGFKSDKDEVVKAFIVRSMKAQGEMDHEVLLQKTIDQFIIESDDVKRILQQLLDSEYIERVDTERYKYVP